MEIIRIVTDSSKHAGCGGFPGMSQDAPEYIVEHEGFETRIPGSEMCAFAAERGSAPKTKWKQTSSHRGLT